MSLHQQVTIHIGNRTILLFLLGALFTGVALPLTGIVPPMPLFLKHQTPQFEVVSQLDRELDELILQKQQLGLTLEKLAELEQKIKVGSEVSLEEVAFISVLWSDTKTALIATMPRD